MPQARRVYGGFQLDQPVRIPMQSIPCKFGLGDRVKVKCFRRAGGTGSWGTVVSMNLPMEQDYGHIRPYQVLLDDCPRRLFRFGLNDLEALE